MAGGYLSLRERMVNALKFERNTTEDFWALKDVSFEVQPGESIGFWTGKNAGSTYSLGELDGTFSGMLLKAPQAVNVALFRPYLWEVRNPLMAISALECFVLFLFTLYVFFIRRNVFFKMIMDPNVIFCLVFSLTFAFAVGISTYNFGTLSRYRIPMMPFYVMALALMFNYSKRERKLAELEVTE